MTNSRRKQTPRSAGSVGSRGHALAALAGLSGDEYRALLGQLFPGCTSSSALSAEQAKRWLAHLQRLADKARGVTRGHAAELTPTQRKMWSLWMQLADVGAINDRTMAGLEAFAFRQTGVAKLAWLNTKQEDTVIESLKQFLDRA